MKVLWLTNIPSPYRVDFFNELGKECELTVLFEKSHSSERDDIWKNYKFENFKGIILGGKSIGVAEAMSWSVVKYLKKGLYDHIVVTNYFDFTGILAVFYMCLKGMRYSVEGDGAFAGSGKGFKEKIKKFVISKAIYCFSTGKEHDNYYLKYGAESENIIRYPFTSIKTADVLCEPLSNNSKKLLKASLGITENKAVLSVGQFIHRKGFDTLIKASANFPKDVGFYIVGGDPADEYIELKESLQLSNVHFIGFKSKVELSDYYKASDVFVLPTREDIWGLVINEAMSCGLPVITTNKCIAGLEMISDDRCILDPEDVEGLSKIMLEILQNTIQSERLSIDNLGTASKYTIETMAKKHIEIFNKS